MVVCEYLFYNYKCEYLFYNYKCEYLFYNYKGFPFYREPDIPGESALTLTLELQDIQPALDLSKLTAEERLAYG